jgi:hypothetical protein
MLIKRSLFGYGNCFLRPPEEFGMKNEFIHEVFTMAFVVSVVSSNFEEHVQILQKWTVQRLQHFESHGDLGIPHFEEYSASKAIGYSVTR